MRACFFRLFQNIFCSHFDSFFCFCSFNGIGVKALNPDPNPGVSSLKPLGGFEVGSAVHFSEVTKMSPRNSRNLAVKTKLTRSGSGLEAIEPHLWKKAIKLFLNIIWYIYIYIYIYHLYRYTYIEGIKIIVEIYSFQVKLTVTLLYQWLIYILFCKNFAVVSVDSSVKSLCSFF